MSEDQRPIARKKYTAISLAELIEASKSKMYCDENGHVKMLVDALEESQARVKELEKELAQIKILVERIAKTDTEDKGTATMSTKMPDPPCIWSSFTDRQVSELESSAHRLHTTGLIDTKALKMVIAKIEKFYWKQETDKVGVPGGVQEREQR